MVGLDDVSLQDLLQDSWSTANDRGLSLAARGAWPDAAAAFGRARAALETIDPLPPAAHEPLALVLGNLAHACFRAGLMAEALQHGQRACALRAAIAGEDGMPVARARMDLAVMLASAQRGDEALSLVRRALAALEHRVGEEDVRLVVVLENAARIALALGAAADAEPLLLRLHALLDAHGLATSRADQLLQRVAAMRQTSIAPEPTAPAPAFASFIDIAPIEVGDVASIGVQGDATVEVGIEDVAPMRVAVVSPPKAEDVMEDVVEEVVAFAPLVVPVDAPIESLAPTPRAPMVAVPFHEDRPLREAVAVTDALLRATPVPLTPRGQPVVLPAGDGAVRVRTPTSNAVHDVDEPRRIRRPRTAPTNQRSDGPILIGVLVLSALGGAAVWWFLVR